MAERSPIIQCEDVPVDEARRMGRGRRMDPELSHALKQNIQALDKTAARLPIPEGTRPTTPQRLPPEGRVNQAHASDISSSLKPLQRPQAAG
jgi:hypothetical protein